jgi:hypothetical protein
MSQGLTLCSQFSCVQRKVQGCTLEEGAAEPQLNMTPAGSKKLQPSIKLLKLKKARDADAAGNKHWEVTAIWNDEARMRTPLIPIRVHLIVASPVAGRLGSGNVGWWCWYS